MTSVVLVLDAYNDGVNDLAAKIQQERAAHIDDLVNLYLEANLVQVPGGLLSLLESMIDNRTVFNQRKTLIDAVELRKHDDKIRDKGRTPYTLKRSAALFDNLNKKLMRDRSVHWNELLNVKEQCDQVSHGGFQDLLNRMLKDRKMFNERRTVLDAAQWENVDTFAEEQLE